MHYDEAGAAMTSPFFRFGKFTLDTQKRLLSENGLPVALGPKVIETLAVLVENAGTLVTKDALMERLWPDRCVEEGNLTQNIYRLRQVLGAAGLRDAIETMACRGYRFVAPVEAVDVLEREAPKYPAAAPRKPARRWIVAASAAACSFALMAANMSQSRAVPAFARLSPESQRLYALGRYFWNLRSDTDDVKVSLRYFEEVVKRDPANPLGYSGVADAYLTFFDIYCDSTVTGCQRIVSLANVNARKAVAVDPNSAEAHTSLAMAINEFTHDAGRSDAEFLRAIALDKNYALAHHWYGNSLLVRGLAAKATLEHKAALAIEPTSPSTYAWLANDAYFNRQYHDAIAYAQESLAIYPDRHQTRVMLGLSYEQLGEERAAIDVFNQFQPAERDAHVAEVYAREGQRAKAIALLRDMSREDALVSGSALDVGFAWLALGDEARAYAFMKAAPLTNHVAQSFLAHDPRLDVLRSDPKFGRFVAPD